MSKFKLATSRNEFWYLKTFLLNLNVLLACEQATPPPPLPEMIPFLLQISAIASLLASSSASLSHDGLALLALKSAIEIDPTRALHSWSESDSTPCHWPGVVCTRNRVSSLFLPNRGLSGYLPSELGLLDSLKRLALSHNNFSKPIPVNLFNATNLISLDLSHNSLSGPIPPHIRALNNLAHLDLSSNLLSGSLPEYLLDLKSIAGTLNLSYNCFSGAVPASFGKLPFMVSLDLRHNNLTGRIPQVGSLVSQGPTAFAGNPSLCGFPLQTPCPEAQNPAIFRSPENPRNPKDPKFSVFHGTVERGKENNGLVTVPLISAVSVVIGVVFLSVWLFRRKLGNSSFKTEKEKMRINGNTYVEEEEIVKFVVLDEGFDIELEDLLRASALVVGKSQTGIVYKVLVGARGSGLIPPTAVAVRRLSEDDTTWRLKDYEVEVEAIGRVQHPNVVQLRAYYYASDEKLLVSDFIRNGSLYAGLHGGSATTTPLSWTARLEIARGSARGLMYIHEYSPRKYVHGSLKSTKILLDDELQPCISGFGLVRLVSKHNSKILASSAVYMAPEARNFGSKITQKCDVYSFGIVLMEILTGRVPDAGAENDANGLECLVRQVFREGRTLSEIIDPALSQEAVHAKKQVIAAFQIALNCTEHDAEVRPRMRAVSESLDRIKSL